MKIFEFFYEKFPRVPMWWKSITCCKGHALLEFPSSAILTNIFEMHDLKERNLPMHAEYLNIYRWGKGNKI